MNELPVDIEAEKKIDKETPVTVESFKLMMHATTNDYTLLLNVISTLTTSIKTVKLFDIAEKLKNEGLLKETREDTYDTLLIWEINEHKGNYLSLGGAGGDEFITFYQKIDICQCDECTARRQKIMEKVEEMLKVDHAPSA